MSKKAEAGKDPGVDQQVADDVTVAEVLPEADLTHLVNGLWPGNPPNRSGNFYFDLNRLELQPEQIGLLGNLCENFVFERVDVHMIRPAEHEFELEILQYDKQTMERFLVSGNAQKTERSHDPVLWRVQPGTFLGKQPVYLKLHDECPKQGRMVINFVGYLIEPWR